MKIKLNRGPMKGKVVNANDDTIRYRVQVPIEASTGLQYPDYDIAPDIESYFTFREGEYQIAHTRLPNGMRVFEWMGWLDGKGDIKDPRKARRRPPRKIDDWWRYSNASK